MSRGKSPNRFATNRTSNLRDAMAISIDGPDVPKTRSQMKKRIKELRDNDSHMVIIGPHKKYGMAFGGIEKLIDDSLIGDTLLPFDCHMDMHFEELCGMWKLDPQTDEPYLWQGPLLEAARKGSVMILENAHMMPLPIMQEVEKLFATNNPHIDAKYTGDLGNVTPSPGFCLIMTMPMKPEKGPLLQMAAASNVLITTKEML